MSYNKTLFVIKLIIGIFSLWLYLYRYCSYTIVIATIVFIILQIQLYYSFNKRYIKIGYIQKETFRLIKSHQRFEFTFQIPEIEFKYIFQMLSLVIFSRFLDCNVQTIFLDFFVQVKTSRSLSQIVTTLAPRCRAKIQKKVLEKKKYKKNKCYNSRLIFNLLIFRHFYLGYLRFIFFVISV